MMDKVGFGKISVIYNAGIHEVRFWRNMTVKFGCVMGVISVKQWYQL